MRNTNGKLTKVLIFLQEKHKKKYFSNFPEPLTFIHFEIHEQIMRLI